MSARVLIRKLRNSYLLRGESRRLFTSSPSPKASTCRALVYSNFGQPEEVVQLQDWQVPDVGEDDIAVEMLMCPVNPVDINTIQGVYPIKPSLPAVAGSEGVGVVTQTGSAVSYVKPGDWVVPAGVGVGTWRTHIVDNVRKFVRISRDVPVNLAATLVVNPCTAYRMLKVFVDLKPGDCVIQNAANSGVGQNVIQLAAAWGIKTINIVRDRLNAEEITSYLYDLGATEVVTEETSGSHKMKDIIKKHGQPVLGFNGVGGTSATNLMKQLAPQSVMVTYGGMARQPVIVSTGSLIFKDLRLRGYWNGKWLQSNLHSSEHLQMMSDLCDLGVEGKLRAPPCTEYHLEYFRAALARAMEPYIGSKQVLRIKPHTMATKPIAERGMGRGDSFLDFSPPNWTL